MERFIGAIFLILQHGMDSLLEFVNHLNTVQSTKNLQEKSSLQKNHYWTW